MDKRDGQERREEERRGEKRRGEERSLLSPLLKSLCSESMRRPQQQWCHCRCSTAQHSTAYPSHTHLTLSPHTLASPTSPHRPHLSQAPPQTPEQNRRTVHNESIKPILSYPTPPHLAATRNPPPHPSFQAKNLPPSTLHYNPTTPIPNPASTTLIAVHTPSPPTTPLTAAPPLLAVVAAAAATP